MCNSEEIEEWRDIPNFEGYYQASSFGKIKSLSRLVSKGRGRKMNFRISERILVTAYDVSGYPQVALCKDGLRKLVKVHQVIAITFLNHTPCGFDVVVDHKNTIKSDNRVINLQLITSRLNISKDRCTLSGATGVSLRPHGALAYITVDGQRYYLGSFSTKEAAASAYERAVSEIGNGPISVKRRVTMTGYTGVRITRQGKFEARVYTKEKTLHLGVFATPELAAIARDQKALELKKPTKCLNFPLTDYITT